jgi:hypothetical protein
MEEAKNMLDNSSGLPQLVGRFGRGQWRFRRSGS